MNIVYVFQDETFYNLRPSLDLYDDWFQTYKSLNYEALTIKKKRNCRNLHVIYEILLKIIIQRQRLYERSCSKFN